MPTGLIIVTLLMFLAIVAGGYFLFEKLVKLEQKGCGLIVLSGALVAGLTVWGVSFSDNIYALFFVGVIALAPWLAFSVVTSKRWLSKKDGGSGVAIKNGKLK